MDCSPPCSSVHGISQARILEWVAISFSGDVPNLRIEPVSLALAGRLFTTEPLAKPFIYNRIRLKNKSPNSVNRSVDKQSIIYLYKGIK